MKSPRMSVLLLLFLLSCAASSLARADDEQLERLIESIEKNELLFQNIDIVFQETYEHVGRVFGGGGMIPTKNRLTQVRYVSQLGKHRADVYEEITSFKGDTRPKAKILAFDGNSTRILSGRIGNLRDGYYATGDRFEPHMVLLPSNQYKFSLSTYLKGDAAIRSSLSGVHWPEDREVAVERLADEDVDGRTCARARIVHSTNIEWVLWLDPQRNYLPVKRQGFTHRFSTSISTGEGKVLSWNEYEPGTWIPEVVEIVAYDKLLIMQEERQVPVWRKEVVVEFVDLNPDYSDEFFANVEFPDGTTVYHIASDGKVIDPVCASSLSEDDAIEEN